jgi:hypothetical protein
MPRFLSREEWPLIAAGVAAGVLASAVVLYLFFTGLGGDPVPASAVNGDSAPAVERRAPGRGVINRREASIVERLNDMEVPLRPLQRPLSVTMRNFVWNEEGGARFAQAEVATGEIEMTALQRGDVVIQNAVVQRPVINLRESASGTWNYEQVMEELLDDEGTNGNGEGRRDPGQRLIQVRGLRIVNGHVDVRRPADHMVFEDVDGQLPVVSVSQPGIADPYLRVADMSTVVVRPEAETRMPLAVPARARARSPWVSRSGSR